MVREKMELGASGRTVAYNVGRLRKAVGWTYTQLSEQLLQLGRPLTPLAVRKIEDGERRVDVDDLMALTVALRVNPNALLIPATKVANRLVQITGSGWVDSVDAWAWAEGKHPLKFDDYAPTPASTIDSRGEEWTRRRDAAERQFLDRIDPLLVIDPGPNVRRPTADRPPRG